MGSSQRRGDELCPRGGYGCPGLKDAPPSPYGLQFIPRGGRGWCDMDGHGRGGALAAFASERGHAHASIWWWFGTREEDGPTMNATEEALYQHCSIR